MPQPPQTLPCLAATPRKILQEAEALIIQSEKAVDDVVATVSACNATFCNVILPLARAEDQRNLTARILGFHRYVSPNKRVREASESAEKMINEHLVKMLAREDIFCLIDAVRSRHEKLDPESQRLLERQYQSYIEHGVSIQGDLRKKTFIKTSKRLVELECNFSKNIIDEEVVIWMSEDDLEGVPNDFLSTRQKQGQNYRLTLPDDASGILQFAVKAKTRQKVFIANENRCLPNTALFREAMELRAQLAELLDYSSYAHLIAERTMLRTPFVIRKFLKDMYSRMLEMARNELKELKRLKCAHVTARGEHNDEHFFLWDYPFYCRMMEERLCKVDHQMISECFPLPFTFPRTLRIIGQLFGLKFAEVSGQARQDLSPLNRGHDTVWHADVRIISVWDATTKGKFVGYLYLDLFSRPGKYRHSGTFNLQPGFVLENGQRRYPVTAIVFNFAQPTSDAPCLLSHGDVVTIFHEFGHGTHDLVSRTTYSTFHGFETSADFSEGPSTMLENWCWDPRILKILSRRPSSKRELDLDALSKRPISDTNGSMPIRMIRNLIASKSLNVALETLRQIHLGTFDVIAHEMPAGTEMTGSSISSLFNSLRKDICLLDGPEVWGSGNTWGHGHASFGHLMDGYQVKYYSYLLAHEYSSHVFNSRFKPDLLSSAQGQLYRRIVLEKGGSQDEILTLNSYANYLPVTSDPKGRADLPVQERQTDNLPLSAGAWSKYLPQDGSVHKNKLI